MAHKINPVLLCGGAGTRLWPLSRKSYPKQFVKLIGDESLFQASARAADRSGFYRPIGCDRRRFSVRRLGTTGRA